MIHKPLLFVHSCFWGKCKTLSSAVCPVGVWENAYYIVFSDIFPKCQGIVECSFPKDGNSLVFERTRYVRPHPRLRELLLAFPFDIKPIHLRLECGVLS